MEGARFQRCQFDLETAVRQTASQQILYPLGPRKMLAVDHVQHPQVLRFTPCR